MIPRLLLFDTVMTIGPQKTTQTFEATDFPALPHYMATVTDILGTWQQANQHVAQIDGSVKSPVFRNVAASLAVAGDPKAVNIQNADISAKFISHLPAPAYPFAINAKMARHGKELFRRTATDATGRSTTTCIPLPRSARIRTARRCSTPRRSRCS